MSNDKMRRAYDKSYISLTDETWVPFKDGWQAALSQSEPVCGMCNGHGMIGGFVNAENGFESNPCPECAVEPVQVSQPVGYFAQLNTGEYIQLLDPQDISEVTPLYTSPPDYQATAYAQAVDQVIALQTTNEALKAENKELKKDVDCCTSANICFKRIKTNLQAENEALKLDAEKLHQRISELANKGRSRNLSISDYSDIEYLQAYFEAHFEDFDELVADRNRLQKDKDAMAIYLKAVRSACSDFKKPYMQVSDFKWTIDKIILEQEK
jgi:hypothetical protein